VNADAAEVGRQVNAIARAAVKNGEIDAHEALDLIGFAALAAEFPEYYDAEDPRYEFFARRGLKLRAPGR